MARRLALMSLRPKYADLILVGEKTIELRRRAVGLKAGDKVLVYASGPVMEVRGSFIVSGVVRLPLNELWRLVRGRASVTRKEFDEYFEGLQEGFAIEIESARQQPSVSLAQLREVWPGFHPPQTLRYLSTPLPKALRAA